MTPAPASFRARFLAGDLLLGAFIKTPTPHATEILGGVGFDFVVIDEEHAPFDRVTIDTVLLAARASQTAGLVRVAEPTPARLLAALDDGAAGVLAPHVASVERRRTWCGGLPLPRRQARLLELPPRRALTASSASGTMSTRPTLPSP